MPRNILLAIASSFLGMGPVIAGVPPAVRDLEEHVRDVIDAAEPSVVAVVVSHSDRYTKIDATDRAKGRLDGYDPPSADPVSARLPPIPEAGKLDLRRPANIADNLYGSGLVVNATKRLVLTTYHLIEGATKIYVRTAAGTGSYANIHAADCRSDLAVLRLIDPVPGLTPIRFADVRTEASVRGGKPSVYRGQFVVAMGHPLATGFGDGSPSASWGILSNVRRRADGPTREDERTQPLYQYGTLLQTDARVTLGCSGGVLLNLDGEAIGLTAPLAAVAGSDSAGGFAVPFDQNYRRIIEVLIAGREVEYGFLGISIAPNAVVLGRRPGLGIGQVTPGTPADKVGLKGFGPGRFSTDGDTITAIDGIPIRDQSDLFLQLGSALAGNVVRLDLTRGDETRQVDVRLAKYDNTLPWIASKPAPNVRGLVPEYSSVLFLQLQRAGDRQALTVGLPDGVVVRDLEPGSPAATHFQPLGGDGTRWMITHVGDKPVATPSEFINAVGSGPVRLTVVDPTNPEQVHTVELPAR